MRSRGAIKWTSTRYTSLVHSGEPQATHIQVHIIFHAQVSLGSFHPLPLRLTPIVPKLNVSLPAKRPSFHQLALLPHQILDGN